MDYLRKLTFQVYHEIYAPYMNSMIMLPRYLKERGMYCDPQNFHLFKELQETIYIFCSDFKNEEDLELLKIQLDFHYPEISNSYNNKTIGKLVLLRRLLLTKPNKEKLSMLFDLVSSESDNFKLCFLFYVIRLTEENDYLSLIE